MAMLRWFAGLTRSEKCAVAAVVDDALFVDSFLLLAREASAARARGQSLLFTQDSLDKIATAGKANARAWKSGTNMDETILWDAADSDISSLPDDQFTVYISDDLVCDPFYSALLERATNEVGTDAGRHRSAKGRYDKALPAAVPTSGLASVDLVVSSTVDKFCQTAVRNVASKHILMEKEADWLSSCVAVGSTSAVDRPDCLFLFVNAFTDWAAAEKIFRSLTNDRIFTQTPDRTSIQRLIFEEQQSKRVFVGLDWVKDSYPLSIHKILLARIEIAMWWAYYFGTGKYSDVPRQVSSSADLPTQVLLSQSPLFVLPSASVLMTICLCVEELKLLWQSMTLLQRKKVVGKFMAPCSMRPYVNIML
jgi:hypothetical protein